MHSLNWKLAGALVVIVIVSVGLTALITNVTTRHEFQQYVIQGNTMHTLGVADSLAGYYSRQQNWNGVQEILPGLLRMNSDRLIVSDDSGRIVGDTGRVAIGGSVDSLGLTGYGVPIELPGRQVGSFYLIQSNANGMMGGMMGMMGGKAIPVTLSNPESSFLANVNRSFWLGGLIAAFAAVLLGLILTRQVTRPVRELTQGVRQIGKGDLNYRVPVKSKDELGELAQSFNLMAGNLAASESSRRRMTADVAHELRTPLAIIEGTVDGILDGVFQPDHQRLMSIKEQTATLTRLIGDLRELSLAESGQLELTFSAENPVDLVRRKVEQAQLWAAEKGIHLQLEAETMPPIYLDRLRIEQVLSNLLTNAVRHTPPDGIITLSVRRSRDETKNSDGIAIAVKDTGEGISAEHLTHIFDRFYRVSDSRARNEGGTGLGLAIVKYLVEAHGGRVWVESELGKGSSFFAWLPFVDKQSTANH